MLAASGAVYAGLALVLGQGVEPGVVMAILGAVFAALGWNSTDTVMLAPQMPSDSSTVSWDSNIRK